MNLTMIFLRLFYAWDVSAEVKTRPTSYTEPHGINPPGFGIIQCALLLHVMNSWSYAKALVPTGRAGSLSLRFCLIFISDRRPQLGVALIPRSSTRFMDCMTVLPVETTSNSARGVWFSLSDTICTPVSLLLQVTRFANSHDGVIWVQCYDLRSKLDP